ncbi:MAG: response regulator [Magnetococcales bacterium]|nr:response regulator [Magnetococcales bacterium]
MEERLLDARVLVIDDQLTNVKLLEKLLQSAGFSNVTGQTDPREAVRLHEIHPHDLVLLDIRMPHMDGFQVLERIRAMEGDEFIPVLVLTAQSDRETRLKALEGGASDFLLKPFDRLEVISRIRNLLQMRMLHNQVREQKRRLEVKVMERTRELHHTRLDIIRRLGRASEFRDNETGLHIIRMSQFCERLTRAMGLGDAACDLMLNASPMHDLGKIGIPDRVLLKPGKLDLEEWEIMQTHAAIGAELLAGGDSELLEQARLIAWTHHERWDGSGYPRGLRGEEIPLLGRIAAIADVFDALTTDRPYKKAWPVEEAVGEIRRQFGRQFDPQLESYFLEVLPQFLAIRGDYADPL